jgi:hypothetical protein
LTASLYRLGQGNGNEIAIPAISKPKGHIMIVTETKRHVPGTAPVGMMIAGTQNTDRKILAIGLAVEEVIWKLRA